MGMEAMVAASQHEVLIHSFIEQILYGTQYIRILQCIIAQNPWLQGAYILFFFKYIYLFLKTKREREREQVREG